MKRKMASDLYFAGIQRILIKNLLWQLHDRLIQQPQFVEYV